MKLLQTRAFTLTELLVAIGLVALLALLLSPVAGLVRKKTQQIHCLGNLAQISAASAAYSTDHQGQFPPNRVNKSLGNQVFSTALLPYLGEIPARPSSHIARSPLVCPAAVDRTRPDTSTWWKGVYTPGKYGLSYAQNYEQTGPVAAYQPTTMTRRAAVERPASMMLYMDYHGHYVVSLFYIGRSDTLSNPALVDRHGGLLNIAYADGSVRPMPIQEIPASASDPFWVGR